MRIVVFTGAGAGKADGLPLQTELFQEFFARGAGGPTRAQLARDVAEFFEVVFGVDASRPAVFPTFEEALGVLELAMNREESIVGLGNEQSNRGLPYYKRQLLLALVATIGRDAKAASYHSHLVASLRTAGLLESITFVTTNYDTLLDDAIEAEGVAPPRGTGSLVDYGIENVGLPEAPGKFAERQRIPCYKIHGSLNWLNCSACDILDITYGSLGVTRLGVCPSNGFEGSATRNAIAHLAQDRRSRWSQWFAIPRKLAPGYYWDRLLVDEPKAARCPSCETARTPIIVPPSYYKSVSNVQLSVVWSKAFRAMCSADQVVFCGYSFPDADMHVKYLVKRAQLNRSTIAQPLQVTLVNHHEGKTEESIRLDLLRFSRFLGGLDVKDSGASFEQFARDPASVLARR